MVVAFLAIDHGTGLLKRYRVKGTSGPASPALPAMELRVASNLASFGGAD